jgi:long-chain acyl-CoA synthetase
MHLLLDLGIDSIGKVELIAGVEARFAFRVSDKAAAKVARVGDLRAVVGDRQPVGEVAGAAGARGAADLWQRQLGVGSTVPPTDGQVPAALVPVRWLLRGVISLFMNTYVHVRAQGRDNIPAKGAFVLAPNHSSHLDSPSVLTAMGGKRRVFVAGAQDYFFSTGLKRLVFGRLLDTIPFDRQSDGVIGLRRCSAVLSRGDGLLLFPEGTRSVTGEMHPFKIGVSVLAIERQVPIVPVHIGGTYDLLGKGARFVRPGTITVRFGRPIKPPPPPDTTDHLEAFRAMTRQVQAAVVELAGGANA